MVRVDYKTFVGENYFRDILSHGITIAQALVSGKKKYT